jgi:hypothetical protein
MGLWFWLFLVSSACFLWSTLKKRPSDDRLISVFITHPKLPALQEHFRKAYEEKKAIGFIIDPVSGNVELYALPNITKEK